MMDEDDIKYDMDHTLDLLERSTILTMPELTRHVTIGLYVIMEAYHISFRKLSRNDWEWIELCENEDSPALSKADIVSRHFDEDAFKKACKHLIDQEEEREKEITKTIEQSSIKYGWVSPSGEFIESPYGSHNESANDIVSKNCWSNDYYKQLTTNPYKTTRDYLIMDKDYILLHNPSNPGAKPYITRNDTLHLTRKQSEFLYKYFMNIGDTLTAETYDV